MVETVLLKISINRTARPMGLAVSFIVGNAHVIHYAFYAATRSLFSLSALQNTT